MKLNTSFKGFSLVELLISMLIISSVGAIIISIFFASLRGSNKSNEASIVRQSGSQTVNLISQMIRNSKSFDGLRVDDASSYTSVCYSPSTAGLPTPTPVPYKQIKITSFDGGTTEIKCPIDTDTVISSKSATAAQASPITDSGKVTVAPSSCVFTCIQSSSTDFPTINFTFTMLSNKDSAVTQTFQSTVVPRNYQR